MNNFFIIVAGGSGSRMGASVPKQFLELKGKPILLHTLEKFYSFDQNAEIIIALPFSEFEYWKSLCEKHSVKIPHLLSEGGKNRFESVKKALNKLSGHGIVCIHDGVRPLVSHTVIERCIDSAKKNGCAIPIRSVEESIREIIDNGSRIANRDNFKIVQTPQCFKSDIILKAYQQNYSTNFTDDASVVESYGHKISLVNGNKENIKITTPEDLVIADSYLK